MQWLDGVFKTLTSSKALIVLLALVLLVLKKYAGITEEEIKWAFGLAGTLVVGQSIVDSVQSFRGTKVPVNITDDERTVAEKRATVVAVTGKGK